MGLVLYAVFSVWHLYSCIQNQQKLRKISKVLLLPALTFWYYRSGGTVGFVYLALLCGWLGDIVLTKPQEYREKVIGSGLFGVGHIFYLICLFKMKVFAGFNFLWIILIVLGIGTGIIVYNKNKEPIIEKMRISCLLYFMLLGGMLGLSIATALSGDARGILRAVGYGCFLISDAMLVTQWFTVGDPHPKSDFKVMLSYIAAQLLIVLSFK